MGGVALDATAFAGASRSGASEPAETVMVRNPVGKIPSPPFEPHVQLTASDASYANGNIYAAGGGSGHNHRETWNLRKKSVLYQAAVNTYREIPCIIT